MIWDFLYYIIVIVLAFIYEVINFPFKVLGLPSVSELLHTLHVDQIFGFITSMIFPAGLASVLFVYISTVIVVELVISVIDRRKQQ